MYKNSHLYSVIQAMKYTESGDEVMNHYYRLNKKTLKQFLKENVYLWSSFLMLNIFLYNYDDRTKYIGDEINKFTLVDVALFIGVSKLFYKEIRIVLRQILKYKLYSSKEEKDVIWRIINRQMYEEL